jgi:hypothetical protein
MTKDMRRWKDLQGCKLANGPLALTAWVAGVVVTPTLAITKYCSRSVFLRTERSVLMRAHFIGIVKVGVLRYVCLVDEIGYGRERWQRSLLFYMCRPWQWWHGLSWSATLSSTKNQSSYRSGLLTPMQLEIVFSSASVGHGSRNSSRPSI